MADLLRSANHIGYVALPARSRRANGSDSRYRSAIAGGMCCSGCEAKAEECCRLGKQLHHRVRLLHVLWVRIVLLRVSVDRYALRFRFLGA